MKFLQPLGLLGLLGIPIIILIYIVKSKYVQKPVSSTFIWKRSLRYVKRKIPLNFIVSLLLILQILTVAAASLAIARPTIVPLSSNETIIIIDSSASMLTSDGEKTRFDLAKEKAIEMADKAGDNSKISIISAGVEAKELIDRSADKIEVTYAIEELECELGEADIDGALELASNIQAVNSDSKIYFYTDKDYDTVERLEVVNFARYEDWNSAILSVTDENVAGAYEFKVTLASYGRDTETVVSLYVDGVLCNSKKITINNVTEDETAVLDPNGESKSMEPTEVLFTSNRRDEVANEVFINRITSYKEAKVTISSQDGITYDNEYYLYSKETSNPRVLFISKWVEMTDQGVADLSKSTFLLASLRNLGLRIETKDIHKSVSEVESYEGYDLYVFDGVMPESLPTDGAVWFIDPPEDPVGTELKIGDSETVTEDTRDKFKLTTGYNSGTDVYKAISKNMSSGRVSLRSYRPILLSEGYESIFECNGETVITAGAELSTRTVIISFDLHDTNLPVYIDFPLLINNMIKYSLKESLEKRSFTVGETVNFYAPAGSKTLSFKKDGTVLNVMSARDTSYTLDSLGNYEIEVEYANGDKKSYMMPTHIAEDESNTKSIGDTVVARDIPSASAPQKEPIEAWPYLIALLLILLVIEWGVYYRDEF
ncbi:MAG: VWA domain-containing protein [Eubacteriales bacterium]